MKIRVEIRSQLNAFFSLLSHWPNGLTSQFKSTQVCKTRTCVRTCEGWPNGRPNLSSTKVNASPHKSMQVNASGWPNQRKSNASPKLASTCESVWPGLKFLLKGKKFFLWININNYTVPYERDGREVCFVICSWDLNELRTRYGNYNYYFSTNALKTYPCNLPHSSWSSCDVTSPQNSLK